MFLIRSLGVGGAERQLVTLAAGLASRGHAVRILTCYEPGALGSDLEQQGVSLGSLGQTSALALVGPLARLRDEVRRWRPDILHGYMPTSNLLSALATSSHGHRVVWGVRSSGIEWENYGFLARASFGLTRLAARRADLIIANSEAGQRFHAAQGYPPDRMIVIPNGIDVERFRPDASVRAQVRAAWGIPPDCTVIAAAARLDPMKDHETLLHAAAASRATLPKAVLVCAGSGSSARRKELEELARSLDVADRVRWLGAGWPMEQLYNGCDLHTSASVSEGFPTRWLRQWHAAFRAWSLTSATRHGSLGRRGSWCRRAILGRSRRDGAGCWQAIASVSARSRERASSRSSVRPGSWCGAKRHCARSLPRAALRMTSGLTADAPLAVRSSVGRTLRGRPRPFGGFLNASAATSPRRMVHVITGLGAGGAEGMLGRLAPRLQALGWEQSVISLRGRGPAAVALDSAGIEVLNTRPVTAFALRGLAHIAWAVRHADAALIQGWMYHGNLASLLARSGAPVVWGIRQCVYDLRAEKPGLRAVIHAGAFGSRWVDHTVYNSMISRNQHGALGYRIEQSTVIPNGFDVERLAPDSNAREASRQMLDVRPDQVVIGMMSRYHPVKGHDIFFRALAVVAAGDEVVAVLAGSGTDSSNRVLMQQITSLGLSQRVRLLGHRADAESLMQAFDIACCPSLSEAFPNVVGEAMTAAIPVVATDVGDVPWLLGAGGSLVPPGDPETLAQALADLVKAPPELRRAIGLEGRRRVIDLFSLDRVAERYNDVYTTALANRASHRESR